MATYNSTGQYFFKHSWHNLIDFIRRYKFELVLITPLFIYVLGLTLLPVLQNVAYGFQQPHQGGGFPTLKSYQELFAQYRFKDALFNTLIIAFLSVSLEMVVGMGVALMLKQNFKGRGIFRAIVLLPMGIPAIVAATNMRYLFASSGYINEILYDFSNLLVRFGMLSQPFEKLDFLQNPLALYTIVVADMWKVLPLVTLILLAGLESIPGDLYEAAEVDGASVLQQFFSITLPLLLPAITSAVVIRGIDAFRIFVLPLAMGVSGEVPVLSSFAYNEYADGHLTISAAASTILLVIILVSVTIYLRLAGTEEVVS
jgi:trehalose transport system permease protein